MARARAANPLRRRAAAPAPPLLPLLLVLAAAVAATAAAEAGFMAAMAATPPQPASLLYSLRVGGAGGGQAEAEALEVRAGEDPVLVALRYCRAHGIGEEGCAQIMQHLCRDTDLLCRSRESLAGRSQKASVVGSAMASWRTTSLDLAGLGDPVECALEVHLLDNDVEKDVELEGNATYLASLVSLHCTNLGRFRPACVCPPGVRAGLVEGLAQESERYRWSASSSHYVRLGVDARADAHEIRRAYRRVSMHVHPDRHRAGEDRRAAEYRATLVNEAYEVLSNVDSRRAYDIERFGRHFVAQTELPRYRAEVSSVFGRFAGVSMDAHGNIKIVL